MIIAIDYDKTYTVDPEFWDIVILEAKKCGHSIICVSMRHDHEGEEVIKNLKNKVDNIIFTGRKAKIEFLKNEGINPSVWVDDCPYWIYYNG